MLDSSSMSKRNYHQNCALARASDVIGERWTLLLLRDLLISPRRFKELHASLKGLGKILEGAGREDEALDEGSVFVRDFLEPGLGHGTFHKN